MKRFLIYLIVVSAAFFFIISFGCKTPSGRQNTPGSVTERFLKHLGNFEFDEARKLGTEKTNQLISMLEMLTELSKEKGADSVLKKKDVQVEILRTDIDGKTAVVTYRGEAEKELTMNLVKEKGKWLVDMKKENPIINGQPNIKIENKSPQKPQQ